MTKKDIFIFGASGHAKVVVDIIEREGRFSISFLVDDNPALKGQDFFGYPVIGGKNDLLSTMAGPQGCIVAIGANTVRQSIALWLERKNFKRVTAVHPSATVGRQVDLGSGSVVMAGATINPDVLIGENVIVNTQASIDHDCRIGNGVHIAPGATLCGAVTVGDGSFIGAGATIIPNVIIGKNVIVGAGSTVTSNLPDNVTAVGSPARIIKTHTNERSRP